MYLRIFKILVLICALSSAASAQQLTNSPYSRYGVGDINYSGNGHSVALGGTGIAESTQMNLNSLNPAGNTSLNLQRFVFDVGFDSKYTNTSSSTVCQKNNSASFKYLDAGFAVKPWWFWGFELKPLSSIGYNVSDTIKINNTFNPGDDYSYSNKMTGDGGLSQVSISTSFKFLKMFSVGVKGGYAWGNFERSNILGESAILYSSAVEYKNNYIMHGVNYRLGFLAQRTFVSKKDTLKPAFKIGIGAYYGAESKMQSRNELFIGHSLNYYTSASKYPTYSVIDTIACDTLHSGKITLPKSYGLGISMEFFDKLLVNADYQYQDWSGFSLPGQEETSAMKENKYYGLGIQFAAAKYSSKYYKTINYRLGFHKSDTYLKVNGYDIEDRGFTFGVGFPIRSLILNVSCDFGSRGTTEHNLYKEKYWLLHFNITAHDVWFVKRKFQ